MQGLSRVSPGHYDNVLESSKILLPISHIANIRRVPSTSFKGAIKGLKDGSLNICPQSKRSLARSPLLLFYLNFLRSLEGLGRLGSSTPTGHLKPVRSGNSGLGFRLQVQRNMKTCPNLKFSPKVDFLSFGKGKAL